MSDFDGWGDDDLDLDDVDEVETTVTPAEEGWGDDHLADTSNFESESGDGQCLANTRPIDHTEEAVADSSGWGEDDDLFSESEARVDEEQLDERAQERTKALAEPESSGWGDDDLDLISDSGDAAVPESANILDRPAAETQLPHIASKPVEHHEVGQPSVEQSGWGDDDDFFDDLDESCDNVSVSHADKAPSGRPQPTVPDTSTPPLLQELLDYLDMIPNLGPSVSAIFQAEFNTPEKAAELLDYYQARPSLSTYTVEKELPRMTYTLLEPRPSGPPLRVTDHQSIVLALTHDPGLAPRCANQSLLADPLQVMTGRDRLIRSRFLATAIATSCEFQVDLHQSWVECDAKLDLLLPSEEGQWKVAEIDLHVSIVVDPTAPYIEYRLDRIHEEPRDDAWKSHVRSVVSLLESLDLPNEEEVGLNDQTVDFRDIFLQNSQAALQNYAVGMRAALQEIDSISGISDKIQRLPGFLPSDLVEAAEQTPVSPPKERPKSLLGGFVRQGLSKLAETVTLPEEDETFYDEWRTEQGGGRSLLPPALYNAADKPIRTPVSNNTYNSTESGGSGLSDTVKQSSPPAPRTQIGETNRTPNDPQTFYENSHNTEPQVSSMGEPKATEKVSKAQLSSSMGYDGAGKIGTNRQAELDTPTAVDQNDTDSPFPRLYKKETPSKTPLGLEESPQQNVKVVDSVNNLSKGTGGQTNRKRWVNPHPGSRRICTM